MTARRATSSGWQIPQELPDLRRVGTLALDTETNDEGLRADRGSAWPWRGGYICGISVAWHDDSGIRGNYFPLRHPDSQNFDRENVARWLKDHIAADVKFTTQNGLYDWGWLRTDLGVAMPSSDQLEEIGALATLIDENRFNYSLDALCDWRGLPGKDTALLEEAIKAAGFKINKKNPLQSYIWQLPAHFVGPYAEADAIEHAGAIREPRPRSSTARARATPIGLTSICCRWSWKCAAAASGSTKAPPNRLATTACRNATGRLPSCRSSSAASSAWQKSRRKTGKRKPLTPIMSIIRGRRKATRRSRPANSGGWPRIPIGCRS